ncbi:conserved hypothetical protein [Caldicellulosiruptor hydrothermalis 108]|uniref:Helix-turn-helix domain-containing protein n=1 Tax=Caldicellulosiruptor hydrothermalis (strain DSM 18901 / VKM B-2411 / 108) TaxID=632292 RepID=E4QBF1_CALH1|nr:helix-turn-helix domain-containing protein [Caldicellulosiruptor hydrothermalis]ADQ06053.1 conserved hypothetical protein [Caldicellulosiruptor hydrothermalis 108]
MNVHELIKKMDEIEKSVAEIKNLLYEMTKEESKGFLTVEELRRKYRIGKNFLYWLCKSNLVDFRYLNRKYYISEKSFLQYLENLRPGKTTAMPTTSKREEHNTKIVQIENKLQKYLESIK